MFYVDNKIGSIPIAFVCIKMDIKDIQGLDDNINYDSV